MDVVATEKLRPSSMALPTPVLQGGVDQQVPQTGEALPSAQYQTDVGQWR